MKNRFYLNSAEEEEDDFDEEEEFDYEYDEDAILDMMFPDRHDEDFDEDNMSWDSVFGDD